MALAAASVLAGPSTAAPLPVETWDYRVERGDTLIGLHGRLMRPDARWQVVQKLNRIADPRRLQPGSTLRIPVALLRSEPVAAEVLHSHGEVVVERPGGARDALVPAALLRAGDLVSTGAQSSASVRFIDGSTVLLGPLGRLRIERLSRLGGAGSAETQLRLDAGALETRVVPARPAPRFELRTPVANLGVRGTEFRSRVAGERVLAEVLEGRVAVAAQTLDAGFGTVASAAGVAPPQPLPAAPGLTGLPLRVERVLLQFAFDAVPGAAGTPLGRGAAQVHWGPEGRPLAAAPRGKRADTRRAKPGLARERPVCGAARRPRSAAVMRRAGDSRRVTARGVRGPRRRAA